MKNKRLRLLLLLLLLPACGESYEPGSEALLVAKKIQGNSELIGGPTARGKIGDYLLGNGYVRFIIAGPQPSFMGGTFGGTLVDADLIRKRADQRNGAGRDSFSEAFPLVNLLVSNPCRDCPDPALSFESYIEDGSDGKVAVVKVSGSSDYLFSMLSYLDKDVLLTFLEKSPKELGLEVPLVGNMPLHQIIKSFLKVDAYGLLQRLQTRLHFETYYRLGAHDRFLTLETVVTPQALPDALASLCPPLGACGLECDGGFQSQQTEVPRGKNKIGVFCPVCKCADGTADMTVFTESVNIFQVILGGLTQWRDPSWKGGMLAGDFLFFGNETDIFCPGIGFDEDRKIFENSWQKVPTLASPLIFDFLAAVAPDVSYGWTSANPVTRTSEKCGTYRLVLASATYDQEKELNDTLVTALGYSEDEARMLVRGLIVDRSPVTLRTFDDDAIPAGGFEAWKQTQLEQLKIEVTAGATKKMELAASVFDPALLDVVPAPSCGQSKLLIPLFSTSATAVLTHFAQPSMKQKAGDVFDANGSYRFTRYFVVGDGDVASVLDTVFKIRKVSHGHARGLVVDERTAAPLSGVSVLAVRDPRPDASTPAPANWQDLAAACRERFGNEGIVSQMKTDRGFDVNLDGSFGGPLEPGRYFLVAFAPGRGASKPVPITVTAGGTVTASIALPSIGELSLLVTDEGGLGITCKASLQPLDDNGEPVLWETGNFTEFGGSRYSEGVRKVDFVKDGKAFFRLPAGPYRLTVSKGPEYSLHVQDLELTAGRTRNLDVVLLREMDTRGWITADFHVHSRASIDSGLPEETRVLSQAAEGIELLASTDHDYLQDYLPFVKALGLEKQVSTLVGVETSTLDFGHFNAFPLKYDLKAVPVNGAPAWYGLPIGQVFNWLRDMAASGYSSSEVIVEANHPRDGMMGYFSALGLLPFSLDRKVGGMQRCNPESVFADCTFNAMEVLNEKNLETLHTPTIEEAKRYNSCMAEILAVTNIDGLKKVCQGLRTAPVADCAALVAKAPETASDLYDRGHCLWHEEFLEDMERAVKLERFIHAKRAAMEAVKALMIRYWVERTPEEDAEYWNTTDANDLGCSIEKAYAGCPDPPVDAGGKRLPGCGLQPCSSQAAAIEDWFRFWNAGFEVTGTGNSDSHDLKKEVGMPRNYVASSSDRPDAMDRHEVLRNVRDARVLISTGPIMDFRLNGATVGGTAKLAKGADLRLFLKVSTASWFGIDRVELYHNGRLELVVPVNSATEDLVDVTLDQKLDTPLADGWYVALAYGLERRNNLAPVYRSSSLGKMMIPAILAMGAESILISFPDLVAIVESLLNKDVKTVLAEALGAAEVPDVFPMFPLVLSNPIRVDVGADGYFPPAGVDADLDGAPDLPSFCPGPCTTAPGATGPVQGECPVGQLCLASPEGSGFQCGIPIPKDCPLAVDQD